MAVDTVSLVGFDPIRVERVEVGGGCRGGIHQGTGGIIAVIFHHTPISTGIGDVEVIIPAAGGKHIILPQQGYCFSGGGGVIQYQTDGQGGSDGGFTGLLVGGFAIQGEHSNRHPLFIHAIQTDERRGEGSQAGFQALLRGVGLDVIQGGEGH